MFWCNSFFTLALNGEKTWYHVKSINLTRKCYFSHYLISLQKFMCKSLSCCNLVILSVNCLKGNSTPNNFFSLSYKMYNYNIILSYYNRSDHHLFATAVFHTLHFSFSALQMAVDWCDWLAQPNKCVVTLMMSGNSGIEVRINKSLWPSFRSLKCRFGVGSSA